MTILLIFMLKKHEKLIEKFRAKASKATMAQSLELRKFNGNRGSKHFIYINRTFFGLYSLMFDLKASAVKINQFKNY